VGEPSGLSVLRVADSVGIPKSAAHRILVNLVDDGYVRQDPSTGDYVLTLRIIAMSLRHLAQNTVVDLARPILNRLGVTSGELVRLSLVDGDRLVWVAKAQGARSGLRYDPDAGSGAALSCTASGYAWLSQYNDQRALELMLRQGLADPARYGPKAPTTIEDYLARLRRARHDGYSSTVDTFEAGAAAVAAPILRRAAGEVVGVLSIAGPSVRLTTSRMVELAEPLLQACGELSGITMEASPELRVSAAGSAQHQPGP
jgi:DNA-binding IclR family transcriptional regulator